MVEASYDWDRIIDRRHTDSEKWTRYGQDVLPLWVADTDFCAPEPVLRALHERVEHGIFGYGREPGELRELLVTRLRHNYGWEVAAETIVFLPGVITGLHLSCRAFAHPGEGVLIQTPVYPPIVRLHQLAKLVGQEMELIRLPDGRYGVDMEAFTQSIDARTRLFVLCNPHNPVGRVFSRCELEDMADLCLRHKLLICSDEIHCDLVYSPHRHTPIASLAPEVAARTITLMAPSKTFNIAGLQCAFAVITDPALRSAFVAAGRGLVPEPNLLAYVATTAAYREGAPWLRSLLGYLQANRDHLVQQVRARLPHMDVIPPEGTFLAWLDCRRMGLPGNPQEFFLQRARVALNDGASFGRGGEGFVRLNLGCPRAILDAAIGRMAEAVAGTWG